MGKRIINTKLSIYSLIMIPHILIYLKKKTLLDKDLTKYARKKNVNVVDFISVCVFQKVFRNLFYYRIGRHLSFLISWLLPIDKSLHIYSPFIGEGAHFEHSYSTYLNANSIGKNFLCLHLVTLGNGAGGKPTIGDNVSIFTGSIVYGNVHIGDNVKISAGTVVNKDIPDNCLVAGNPAYIIRNNGVECNVKL